MIYSEFQCLNCEKSPENISWKLLFKWYHNFVKFKLQYVWSSAKNKLSSLQSKMCENDVFIYIYLYIMGAALCNKWHHV